MLTARSLMIGGWLLLLAAGCNAPTTQDDPLLTQLISADTSLRYEVAHRDSLEIQILYTRIDRDSLNQPHFTSHGFGLDSSSYFYPASTIKLPIAVMALEKLQDLKSYKVNKFTTVFHDSAFSGQRPIRFDPSAETGLPSMAQYIRKVLMVSDNNASNALYEFLGQQEANDRVRKKGYHIRVLHRLSRAATIEENRHTEGVWFTRNDSVLLRLPPQANPDSIRPSRKVYKGIGYREGDRLIQKPFDFTYKNEFPLQDQQDILKAILFPFSMPPARQFNISDDDRRFLMQYMSQYPRETNWPPYYRDTTLYDAAVKYLMVAQQKQPISPSIWIFNKIGGAYGYLIDNAYIVDFDHGIEFMLSAVISTNRDGIYNDDRYDYETIGYPFLRKLGQCIYRYELTRPRAHKPDLSAFRITYDR